MGIYLSTPKTEKFSEDGENERLRFGLSSMQGWRATMEDAHAALPELDNCTSFFGVYDGHGGKVVAKFCAKYLHTQVLKHEAYSAGDLGASVLKAFFRMDEMMRGQRGWRELAILGDKINKLTGMIEGLIWSPRGGDSHEQIDDWAFEEGPHSDFAGPTSGCTACVAIIRDNQLIVANAGDSRCVISRKGQAYNLSRDHKPELEVERERILKAGGFIHAGRVNGSLNLARAIGDMEFKQNKFLPADKQIVTANPDINIVELCDDDDFIVLACDGIWDCMTSQQLVDFIHEHINAENRLSFLSLAGQSRYLSKMVSRQEETRRISNEEDDDDKEARSFVMQLASAVALPMTVRAALELELPEIIARAGPGAQLSPTEIAAQIPTQNPQAPVTLDRILRLLASYNVLTCSLVDDEGGKVGRRYGLGPVCKYLTRNEDGASMAPFALTSHDSVFLKAWYYMKEAVMDGAVPFDKAYGMTAFEYPGTDPRFNRVFNAGMSSHSSVTMKKMLEMYGGFEGINVLVDVGGGVGTNLNIIISKHPTIRGINFDLPHVIADAPPQQGLEHVGGDMFESVPCGDAIFMKWILHDWSDQHCVKVLKNCWKALPETGKVIVVEGILPVAPETTKEAQGQFHMDLLMLAYNPGGKERTEAEFESLAMEAGFSQLRKVCTAFNAWIMEFTK